MIKVSVCTITYNHGPYIAQAIEGVLAQRSPGLEIEMVIGDDLSSDNTREIVADYAQRFPEVIKPLFHEKNLGPFGNSQACMAACTGKYVAALEGDDYWTDSRKLARQVEFLEANSDFSFCFHNALVLYEDGSGRASHLMTFDQKFEYTLADIVSGWNVATASVVYRRDLLPIFPAWVQEGTAGDLPLFAILANQGRVAFFPEVMSVYRINGGGITRSANGEKFMLGIMKMHENVNKYLNYRYNHEFVLKYIENYKILSSIASFKGQYMKAMNYQYSMIKIKMSIGEFLNATEIKGILSIPWTWLKSIKSK